VVLRPSQKEPPPKAACSRLGPRDCGSIFSWVLVRWWLAIEVREGPRVGGKVCCRRSRRSPISDTATRIENRGELQPRDPESGRPLAGRSQGHNQTVANLLRQHCNNAILIPTDSDRARFSHSVGCELNSHQTPVGIKLAAMPCDRPGGTCRPRETLVPSRVQGVACIPYGYHRDDDASERGCRARSGRR
jgi:hypothetical protein